MKFKEDGGRDAVVRLLVLVDRADGLLADDVAARDRHAGLDGLDHGIGAAIDAVESAHRRRHRLLHRVEPHRHFGDDAEGALGADEQARQVVAGRRLLRAARGLDDAAVGQHYLERQHVLAHRAVAHGVGARGARRRHAAERGVGARIDREEEARVLDELVELLARHAGLHHGVEVRLVHRQHLVHLRQVDADAAFHRQDVALERGADAVGNHRHLVPAADVDDVAHLFGGLGEDHHVRGRVRKVGLVLAVVLAHRGRGGHPLAEQGLQLGDHGLVEALPCGFLHGGPEFQSLVHGAILVSSRRRRGP
jgi:hypothetical protein